jgi:hypothetical protein
VSSWLAFISSIIPYHTLYPISGPFPRPKSVKSAFFGSRPDPPPTRFKPSAPRPRGSDGGFDVPGSAGRLRPPRQTSAKGSAEHEAAFFGPGTSPRTSPTFETPQPSTAAFSGCSVFLPRPISKRGISGYHVANDPWPQGPGVADRFFPTARRFPCRRSG